LEVKAGATGLQRQPARTLQTGLGNLNDDLSAGATAALARINHTPHIGVVFVVLSAREAHRLGTIKAERRP